MTHSVTRHACDMCGREYKTQEGAAKHETNCYHNPLVKACVTCGNFCAFVVHTGYGPMNDDEFNFLETRCIIDLDIEDTGMCNGSIERVLRSRCDGWEARSVVGSYQYGKHWLEVKP